MTAVSATPSTLRSVLVPAVVVGALGYFVDIYDLILFSIVRVPSLKDLGLSGSDLTDKGLFLINMQMAGMLLGGILWGVLGDRRGRVVLLFGSICLYSAANIANGLVQSVEAYAIWRFIAGVGLAGELGGSITLVSEVLPKESRGYGTMIVATVGVFGAVVAALIAARFSWRVSYFIGGGLGFALLLLRYGVLESGMFRKVQTAPEDGIARGNFLSLFTNGRRFFKYLCCILIGLPTWYVVGILVTFSPEFARALDVQGEISAGTAVMLCYLGITLGDFFSGSGSQWVRSRRKVVAAFLIAALVVIAIYFRARGASVEGFYAIIFCLGFTMGYWAVFVTIGAEQFGTNLRATVATTVPNFARGSLPLIALSFAKAKETGLGLLGGGLVVGVICIVIALVALAGLEETYGKDLDYVER
ncbi:MFS transporter [Verrucomicrobia bacterium SCGC AG-212-E04]|nr:MFS transporter [Verrucomicrobia bacterium SCGC AG-212-E04]